MTINNAAIKIQSKARQINAKKYKKQIELLTHTKNELEKMNAIGAGTSIAQEEIFALQQQIHSQLPDESLIPLLSVSKDQRRCLFESLGNDGIDQARLNILVRKHRVEDYKSNIEDPNNEILETKSGRLVYYIVRPRDIQIGHTFYEYEFCSRIHSFTIKKRFNDYDEITGISSPHCFRSYRQRLIIPDRRCIEESMSQLEKRVISLHNDIEALKQKKAEFETLKTEYELISKYFFDQCSTKVCASG